MRPIKVSIAISFWALSLFLAPVSHAQSAQANNYTISGHIADASNGEQLLGATVWCGALSSGAGTNAYGFYSLTLPEGTHEVLV